MGLCKYENLLLRLSEDHSLTTSANEIETEEPDTLSCPLNMVYKNCTCEGTCQDPSGCYNECTENVGCFCPNGFLMDGNDCVPMEQCGCFLNGVGVLRDNETFVNSSCSQKCLCSNDVLNCEEYSCSPNAACEEKDEGSECVCNPRFLGDGQICLPFGDCQDFYNDGYPSDGDFYTIKPLNWQGDAFNVYCDMSHGGGWTVIQRREDGTVDFLRNWEDYKNGFGMLDHEFWLGNDKIYYLTNQKNYTIRFDAVDKVGTPFYEEYDFFRITDETSNYTLISLGNVTGNAMDVAAGAFLTNLGSSFSTIDRDNDGNNERHCAEESKSGWWHLSCTNVNANGLYSGGFVWGIFYWSFLPNAVDLPFIEMKIRPS